MTTYKALLIGIIFLALFLDLYRLSDLMMFIGDQGWFYLSARDTLTQGTIPLVGITSSHTWLHQGSLWTYMLALALGISHFNPVSGAYLAVFLGIVTTILIYKTGKEMFSKRIGLLCVLLYATTPLVIIHSRMAYHTNPIPLLTLLLFYSLLKWIKGSKYFFPIIFLLFTTLYNFELATFTLFPIFIIVFVIGIIARQKFVKVVLIKRIIFLSLGAIILPMIPMILYDIHHGFPQTLKFIIWIGYKIAVTFGYPPIHETTVGETYQTMIPFIGTLINRLIFLPNLTISLFILVVSFINLGYTAFHFIKRKKYLNSYTLLFLLFAVPTIGYILAKTNSEGYTLVFFPIVAIMMALLIDKLLSNTNLRIPAIVSVSLFVLVNSYYLIANNYLMGENGYGPPFSKRLEVAKKIVAESAGMEYNLIGRGEHSQYESFTMNYEYLVWWLGHPPSKNKKKLVFVLEEKNGEIYLTKK